jgi:membrane fusion protein (multidrug efflux system)
VVDQGDGKQVVQRTEVELGLRRQGEVEVVAGLTPEDVVVTAGLLKIRDGAQVKLLHPEGGPPEAPSAPAAGSTAAAIRPAAG